MTPPAHPCQALGGSMTHSATLVDPVELRRQVQEKYRDVESFAGVNNPFSMGDLASGEVVVDVGSGAGFDSILAAGMVGPTGRVIGVDMTPEMRAKAAANAQL